MTQLEAAIGEFQKTVADLGIRLANLAAENAVLRKENEDLKAKDATDKG